MSTTAAPARASQTVAPPDLAIPTPPPSAGLTQARGITPWTAQIEAVPSVLLELEGNDSFTSTFGPLVPESANLVTDLTNAAAWTKLRQELTDYLAYANEQEVLTWSHAKRELDGIGKLFHIIAEQNPQLLVELPALARLLDVTRKSAQVGVTTRRAKKKAKARLAQG